MRYVFAAALTSAGVWSVQAGAVTVSATPTLSGFELAAATNDVPAPTVSSGAFLANVTGSVDDLRRSPFDTITTLVDDEKYNSVGRGASATYIFPSVQSEFSLIWGSPDTYNRLSFFLDGTLVDLGPLGPSISGDEIAAIAGLSALGQQFASVDITDIMFDAVAFRSPDGNAFEFAFGQEPSVIPLPAAGWMALSSLGVLALARRRAT